MPLVKLILVDAIRRMPWKSGGGVTTEIAIAPAGTMLDHFDRRVSTAQVDAAGPFSRFAGIDRSLAAIADGRLTMHRVEAEAMTLVPGGAPVRFPGETDVHTTLDVPLPDFSVMTRRDAWAHRAEAITFAIDERHSLPRLHAGMQWPVHCVYDVLSIGADDIPQGAAAWPDIRDNPDVVIARVGFVSYMHLRAHEMTEAV